MVSTAAVPSVGPMLAAGGAEEPPPAATWDCNLNISSLWPASV